MVRLYAGLWPSTGNDGPCTCTSQSFDPSAVRCVPSFRSCSLTSFLHVNFPATPSCLRCAALAFVFSLVATWKQCLRRFPLVLLACLSVYSVHCSCAVRITHRARVRRSRRLRRSSTFGGLRTMARTVRMLGCRGRMRFQTPRVYAHKGPRASHSGDIALRLASPTDHACNSARHFRARVCHSSQMHALAGCALLRCVTWVLCWVLQRTSGTTSTPSMARALNQSRSCQTRYVCWNAL